MNKTLMRRLDRVAARVNPTIERMAFRVVFVGPGGTRTDERVFHVGGDPEDYSAATHVPKSMKGSQRTECD